MRFIYKYDLCSDYPCRGKNACCCRFFLFCFVFFFLVLSFVLSTLNTFFGETQLVEQKNNKGHSINTYTNCAYSICV